MGPKVAIVVLGYNSQIYLADCLASLQKSTYTNYSIVFVDNKSSDNSVAFVKEHFPKVEVVENKDNYGFAKGNNQGIRHALSKGVDYVFVLNPDTIIAPDCLTQLVDQADTKTIVQPLILLDPKKKTDLINTTGHYVQYLGFSYVGDYKVDRKNIKDKPIASASGAAMFLPKAVLEKVGYFDEDFFMYGEDLDLSWRARLAGFDIRLVSQALVWHDYSFSRNARKMELSEQNRWLFLLKNFEIKTLVLILPMLLLNEVAILLFAVAGGWIKGKLRSYWSVIRLFPETVAKRRQITLNKVKSDSELKKLLGSTLSFSEVHLPLLSLYNSVISLYWRLIYPLI